MIDSLGPTNGPNAIRVAPPPSTADVQYTSQSTQTQASDDRKADASPWGRATLPDAPRQQRSSITAVELVNKAVELQQQLAAGYLDMMM
ncbi:hypothetical protein K227x_01900 [Rubripirellula lacrimiformis]|uniref:Uncharacterized protein n=1 Tax=Rubripirellula lacrimiformis TaxID=1930273 RepID=A0A517N3W1_9BACT|nr:hypothetical protein [Rubripirellula lacrimiformis]QDT01822.1 hypothetical protein K227x_01900 [Rubripirellula lacrimiformis]